LSGLSGSIFTENAFFKSNFCKAVKDTCPHPAAHQQQVLWASGKQTHRPETLTAYYFKWIFFHFLSAFSFLIFRLKKNHF
jgi:hypothetical protein